MNYINVKDAWEQTTARKEELDADKEEILERELEGVFDVIQDNIDIGRYELSKSIKLSSEAHKKLIDLGYSIKGNRTGNYKIGWAKDPNIDFNIKGEE